VGGHFGIGVTAKDAEARERVRGIAESLDGHFINFYGNLVIEVPGPQPAKLEESETDQRKRRT